MFIKTLGMRLKLLSYIYISRWYSVKNESWQNESWARGKFQAHLAPGRYNSLQTENDANYLDLTLALRPFSFEILDKSTSVSLSFLIHRVRVTVPVSALLWGVYEFVHAAGIQQRLTIIIIIFIITLAISILSSFSILFLFSP